MGFAVIDNQHSEGCQPRRIPPYKMQIHVGCCQDDRMEFKRIKLEIAQEKALATIRALSQDLVDNVPVHIS
jgi:hypothetical protein